MLQILFGTKAVIFNHPNIALKHSKSSKFNHSHFSEIYWVSANEKTKQKQAVAKIFIAFDCQNLQKKSLA